jgi:hypothetical protein
MLRTEFHPEDGVTLTDAEGQGERPPRRRFVWAATGCPVLAQVMQIRVSRAMGTMLSGPVSCATAVRSDLAMALGCSLWRQGRCVFAPARP